jgi:hypothetical protein
MSDCGSDRHLSASPAGRWPAPAAAGFRVGVIVAQCCANWHCGGGQCDLLRTDHYRTA